MDEKKVISKKGGEKFSPKIIRRLDDLIVMWLLPEHPHGDYELNKQQNPNNE